jgi:DNA invertase Pin-like site-specific DNA recombinase
MKTIAYLRVSQDSQDVRNQRLAILEFARQEQLTLTDFMALSVSSRRSPKERQIDALLARLEAGDTLVVSEGSRMGRSVGEIMTVIDALVKQKVRFLAIKEGIRLEGQPNGQRKVLVTLFSLFADIERELSALRPKGKLGWSKLTGKEEEIQKLLQLKVSKASIAKITGVDRSTLAHFLRSRHLLPQDDTP